MFRRRYPLIVRPFVGQDRVELARNPEPCRVRNLGHIVSNHRYKVDI